MKVALISDIHANLPALEAVLERIEAEKISRIWNLGDLTGYGPHPNEVIELLEGRKVISIIGNYDLKVLKFPKKIEKWRRKKSADKFKAFEWTYGQLKSPNRSYLKNLPEEFRLDVDGKSVVMVHGSVTSNSEHLGPETPIERLSQLADVCRCDVITCGHSHRGFHRRVDGVDFINPGSVGRPEGNDRRASFAFVDISSDNVEVQLCRVEYDVERTVRAIREASLPENFAKMLKYGKNLEEIQAQLRSNPAKDELVLEDSRMLPIVALAESCSYEREHAHQVTHLSMMLFDNLRDVMKLGDNDRFLLKSASVLHDIGWVQGPRKHHKVSLKMILAATGLGLDEGDVLIVANIARYHRKSLPKLKHEYYAELGESDRLRVRQLAGILRVADGLDRSHSNSVQNLKVETDSGKIDFLCEFHGSGDPEKYAVMKKADLLRLELGRDIRVTAI